MLKPMDGATECTGASKFVPGCMVPPQCIQIRSKFNIEKIPGLLFKSKGRGGFLVVRATVTGGALPTVNPSCTRCRLLPTVGDGEYAPGGKATTLIEKYQGCVL